MISIQFHLTRAILDILSAETQITMRNKELIIEYLNKKKLSIYIDSKRDFFLKLAFSRPV